MIHTYISLQIIPLIVSKWKSWWNLKQDPGYLYLEILTWCCTQTKPRGNTANVCLVTLNSGLHDHIQSCVKESLHTNEDQEKPLKAHRAELNKQQDFWQEKRQKWKCLAIMHNAHNAQSIPAQTPHTNYQAQWGFGGSGLEALYIVR